MMWALAVIIAAIAASLVDWGMLRCRLLGHPLMFSPPRELTDGFAWTASCTRCPEHGELFVRCGEGKKDRLFVYCPQTDHPMSPRYCMKSPHLPECVDCAYKANPSLAESAL